MNHPSSETKTISERQLLFLLACVQFTHVLDFVLMMPLGPTFLRVFKIEPSQFGLMISSYTFAAGITGFIGALFLDRFDRKRALLFLYAGFIVGTLLCALSTDHQFFLVARAIAGSFAGVMQGVIFAIIGDAVHENRRGRATGVVMSAFSFATVVGVPFGLFLASRFSWRAPFLFLGGFSIFVLILGSFRLPSFQNHLLEKKKILKESALKHLTYIIFDRNHLKAFLLTIVLMYSAFSVIPYVSTAMVLNSGVPEDKLFLLYLVGGAVTFFFSRGSGIISDRFGKLRVFRVMTWISLIPVIIITQLGLISIPMAIGAVTFYMSFNSARYVPALAMVMSTVEPRHRGGFMSINAAAQQLAIGAASTISGLIIIQDEVTKHIYHFGRVGYISVAFAIFGIWLGGKLKYVA